MKSIFLSIIVSCLAFTFVTAQDDAKISKKLYDPNADAKSDIEKAISKAKKEGKHVLLQIGGNWCGWCIAFDKKVNESEELKKLMNDNYVIYHLNYTKENKNSDILKDLALPQRLSFPVFVVLGANGSRLHTQNSAYLEEGEGHSVQKIKDFLENWTTKALDPKSYKE